LQSQEIHFAIWKKVYIMQYIVATGRLPSQATISNIIIMTQLQKIKLKLEDKSCNYARL